MTWAYKRTEPNLWTVGWEDYLGNWHTDSDHSSKEEAAQRVVLLNGGAKVVEIDLIADDTYQVEIQNEMGWPDRFKLYIQENGKTVVRVCKLKEEQIRNRTGVDFLALGW